MAHGNSCSLSNSRSLSFSGNFILRQAPWALGLAVLAAVTLGALGAAQAQISVYNPEQFWSGAGTAGAAGGDTPLNYTTTSSFTITAGASVLVVQYDGLCNLTTPVDVVPTI